MRYLGVLSRYILFEAEALNTHLGMATLEVKKGRKIRTQCSRSQRKKVLQGRVSEQLWKQAEDQKLNPACAQVETDWDLVAVLFGE